MKNSILMNAKPVTRTTYLNWVAITNSVHTELKFHVNQFLLNAASQVQNIRELLPKQCSK